MELVLPVRARHRARTTALVAALSLVVAPLVVAPAAVAATDPSPTGQVAVEQPEDPTSPTTATDVVAPAPEQLTLTGTLRVGEQVSVDPRADLWTPAGAELAYSYRWLADDQELAGQDGTLVVPPDAVGRVLSVEITGTAPDGASSASVVVPAAAAVAPGVITPGELGITGDPRVGESLTAVAGAWAPAVQPTFEWRRGDVVVSTGDTYVPVVDDLGSPLTVVASGTAEGYEPATVTATTAAVTAGTIAGDAPALSGTVRVGSRITVVPGQWPADATLTYRWTVARATGTATVATTASYTPTADDRGRLLTVAVTGTRPGYETTRTTTPVTVGAGVLTAPTPTLSGTVRVGSKVTAHRGTWTSGTAVTYRWYASGAAISGATASTYTPSAAVKGKNLTVRVTGTKAGYTTTYRTSAATRVAAGVLTAPRPRISGTVRVGAKVSVAKGTWKPSASTYRYQWRVNGTKIRWATRSTYTLPSKYAGKKLTVTVTGSRAGYTTRSVTSAASTVLRVYSKTSAPKISGSARVGSTLKVSSRGTWTPAPSSWRYQWRANGTPIKGATRSSIKLAGAQYGKRISVTIKGVRSGYYPTARTSGATARVTVPAPVLTKNGVYKVGTQIKAGTYVAPGSSSGCVVKRLDGSKKMVWAGLTYGQTIVTVRSTDKYFSTTGCGTWRRYAAYGAVRTSTPADGIYKVGTAGGQLKPGLYRTAGPAFSDDVCYVAALNGFAMTHAAIDESTEFTGGGYWRVLPGDVGFEAYGCSWRRVSN
ncbi:hypothetical protein [Isoptericola sp. NPDC057191]|uniref:hypothetical protein n=1 Tax=Isoptericola sp. NPDC057191 TaxID=3346041 RepID=UPI0036312DC4